MLHIGDKGHIHSNSYTVCSKKDIQHLYIQIMQQVENTHYILSKKALVNIS